MATDTLTLRESIAQPRPRLSTVRAAIRGIRRTLRSEIRATESYRDGLAAEDQTSRRRRAEALTVARRQAREVYLSRQGRRIDLPGLLRQRDGAGKPLWAIFDPMQQLYNGACRMSEGKRDSDGTMMISGKWVKIPGCDWKNQSGVVTAFLPAGGIPPIPARARELFRDRKIRRRAKWVGLLYQPEEWLAAKPDPAVVVEWCDRPGEYYALAVWGGDFRQIMEFVH